MHCRHVAVLGALLSGFFDSIRRDLGMVRCCSERIEHVVPPHIYPSHFAVRAEYRCCRRARAAASDTLQQRHIIIVLHLHGHFRLNELVQLLIEGLIEGSQQQRHIFGKLLARLPRCLFIASPFHLVLPRTHTSPTPRITSSALFLLPPPQNALNDKCGSYRTLLRVFAALSRMISVFKRIIFLLAATAFVCIAPKQNVWIIVPDCAVCTSSLGAPLVSTSFRLPANLDLCTCDIISLG
jgi:hypothetical protein